MKVLFIILTILLLIAIFYFGASAYIAYQLTIQKPSPITFDRNNIGRGTDVVFRSADNLQLAGWYFPGTNDKAIMMVHGAGSQNRANEVYGAPEIAKHFLEQGYTILMFDLRGTGESTQARISFGYNEQQDIKGAFEYLKTQDFKSESIVIISDSLGAIATIMAADGIKDSGGIVLDSPATEVREIVSNIMNNEHSIPKFVHPGVYIMAKIIYGIDIEAVRPIDKVSTLSSTPLLFLHGAADTLIPPSHSELLLEQVENGTRVLFPDTEHVLTYKKHPELYLRVIGEFFDKNLK